VILQETAIHISPFMSNDHAANDAVHFRNILYTLMGVSLFLYVYLQCVVYCHYATKFFRYSMY